MMSAIKNNISTLSAMLFGFGVAIIFAPIVLATADWYAEWDEATNPPATLQWNTIERLDVDSLRITMMVTRHKDCSMVRVLGYTGNSLTAMQPAETLEREDLRIPQSYPVGISVISRPWILRGIFGDKMAVAAYYDCNDRVVKAPLLIGNVPGMTP